MKKTLFALILSIFAIGGIQAQKITVGAKAGLNLTSLSGDIEDAAMKGGVHVGAFVELKLLDAIAIQPELLFSMQGTAQEVTGGDNVKLNTNYVNIPVMLKFYVVPGLLNVQVGPQFGVLLSASYSDDLDALLGDPKEFLKSSDLSGCFGLGVDISKLRLSARYNLGLSNISDVSGIAGAQEFVQRNQVFQFSVGYAF